MSVPLIPNPKLTKSVSRLCVVSKFQVEKIREYACYSRVREVK